MINNYPIKYAIMPIINKTKRENITIANIVSKCYVIEEHKKYFSNGNFQFNYDVVFPYKKNDINYHNTKDGIVYYEEWKRITPDFDFSGQCNNSTLVNNIFDSFEAATIAVDIKNKEILLKEMAWLPINEEFNKEFEKMKERQEKTIKQYKNLETKIENETYDMVVNNILTPQTTIVLNNIDKTLVFDTISLYDCIKNFENVSFYVCSISTKECSTIREQIELNDKLEDTKCDSNRYLLAKYVKNKIIRIANYNSKAKKGSYYLDKDYVLHYDKNMYQFFEEPTFQKTNYDVKIYTTETFDDIINSYKQRNNIQIRISKEEPIKHQKPELNIKRLKKEVNNQNQ